MVVARVLVTVVLVADVVRRVGEDEVERPGPGKDVERILMAEFDEGRPVRGRREDRGLAVTFDRDDPRVRAGQQAGHQPGGADPDAGTEFEDGATVRHHGGEDREQPAYLRCARQPEARRHANPSRHDRPLGGVEIGSFGKVRLAE